jgi:hypothetical protein
MDLLVGLVFFDGAGGAFCLLRLVVGHGWTEGGTADYIVDVCCGCSIIHDRV